MCRRSPSDRQAVPIAAIGVGIYDVVRYDGVTIAPTRYTDMGDSSVACAFSGLTLHNELCVVIPVVPNRHASKPDGAFQFEQPYAPKCLPIVCQLDDYSRPETICPSVTVDAIAEIYGKP